jgi:hypothetical protein
MAWSSSVSARHNHRRPSLGSATWHPTIVATSIDPLEYELHAERAASLGRVAAQMEAAVAALRAFDRGERPAGVRRDDLFAHAADRVWCYVVQREALGWRDHTEALALYQVPPELIARMGPRRRV